MNGPVLEICAGSYACAMAAWRGGAQRIELCANLVIGGTTPTQALFEQVRRDCGLKIHVLIRPRFGDFLYTGEELEEMARSISLFRQLGADGVVIGALTPQGDLDVERMKRLMDQAGDLSVTLHRAFDMTRDPRQALEDAVSLGCHTILTSGQAQSAPQGIPLLKDLHRRAGGRIAIMAGSGVKSGNIPVIHGETGITCFHATARTAVQDSAMVYRKQGVSMGLPSLSEYSLLLTDEGEVRRCAQAVRGLS